MLTNIPSQAVRMNPAQQQQDFYYTNGTNRSPTSVRQGYATSTLPAGLGVSRQSSVRQQQQQQYDFAGQPSNAIYATSTDRFASTLGDERYRQDAMPTTAATLGHSFMMNNAVSWNYNGMVNTVNGPIGSEGRASRMARARLPDTWTQPADATNLATTPTMIPNPQLYAGQALAGPSYGQLPNGADAFGPLQVGPFPELRQSVQEKKDDLIPTAIVIKNIPFAVRKEQLQQVMVDMNLPQPYAFNYHFDKGVFRGLAFANFSTAGDTKTVIDAMNHLEVSGRQLRVEYKKMLPEHERERIEREKRQKRGQLEEQHRPIALQHQESLQSLASNHEAIQRQASPNSQLDMNDPMVLQFYTELAVFARDVSKEVYVFPSHITPDQRRIIHTLAHNMGLNHESVGEGDSRQVTVRRRTFATPASPLQQQQQQLQQLSAAESRTRGLSRAATFDLSQARGAVSSAEYGSMGRQGGSTLEVPGNSPDNPMSLRSAKSFADLRTHNTTPSDTPEPVYPGSYTSAMPGVNGMGALPTPATPGATLTNRASEASLANSFQSMSLNNGFDSSRQRDNPGAIGSQRPGANGFGGGRAAPERQPRGPDSGWESSGGFNSRSRTNGHIQRGSGSSNLTSQDSLSDLLNGSRADSSDLRSANTVGGPSLFSHH